MELIKKLFRFAGEVDKKTALAVNILGWILTDFFLVADSNTGLD